MPAWLRVEDLWAGPGGRPVLRGASLEAGPGEAIVVYGPNGAGKTTLLRVLAGLLEPQRGLVSLGGERPTPGAASMLFQNPFYQLGYPTVLDAVKAPLEARGLSRREAEERAMAVLSLLGAEGLAGRNPYRLSEGEARLAALAQAAAAEPRLLLLDEPLAGLDPGQVWAAAALARGLAERGAVVVAAVLPRHAVLAARLLSARLLELRDGRLEEREAPPEKPS